MIAAAPVTALATARSDALAHLRTVPTAIRAVSEQLRRAAEDWNDATAPRQLALLIEDDENLAALVARSIEEELGLEVTVATTYEHGRSLVAALPWAVVILDLALGDPLGRTGLGLIREVPRTTPLVIASGRLSEDALHSLSRRASCGYYVKAATGMDLLDVIRRTMARHA